MEQTFEEKTKKLLKLEKEGNKTYLFNLDWRANMIMNELSNHADDIFFEKDTEELFNKLKEAGSNIEDITSLPHIEQVKLVYNKMLKELDKAIADKEYEEQGEDYPGYWYLRGIGDNEEWRGNKMSLQYCLSDTQALFIEEILYQKYKELI